MTPEERIQQLESQVEILLQWMNQNDHTAVKALSPGKLALGVAYVRTEVLTIRGQSCEIPVLQ